MASAVVCIAVYVLIFSMTYYSSLKEEKGKKLVLTDTKYHIPFYVSLGAIFVVQLVSTQFSIGYINDTKLFRSWTSFGENYHIWEYYTSGQYVDYPPAYLIVLFITGKIASVFGVDSQSDLYLCFVRFVPILFDMLCSIFIFRMGRKKLGDKPAMTLALLSAVNPINIFNSTVWGQIDSVVSLMIVGVLLFLYKRKYVAATTLFVLSVLTKPQMIIYAPVLGFTILFDFVEVVKNKDGYGVSKMLKSIGFSVMAVVGVVVIVPLAVTGGNYMLLIDKYKNAMGLYQYATVCAANFYGAFGGNWVKNTETFFIFPYKAWGFISIVSMSLIIGYVMYKAKDRSKIFYMAAYTVSTIFMFAHGMHERYIHALFLMLIVLYIIKKDPKLLAVYLMFSMSNLVNCVLTLIKNHQDDFIYGNNALFIFNSWINILIYIFMAYIFYIALFKDKDYVPIWTKIKNSWGRRDYQFMTAPDKRPMLKKDYLIMAVITLVYAVVAFWNLGSMSVPEKGWYPETANESVVIDLGETKDIHRIYTHSGWIDRHVTEKNINRQLAIEVSEDGETFEPVSTVLELNKVFAWKATGFEQNARFIKLTPNDDRFYLNEIAFFGNSESEKYVPVAVISSNETAQYLIDEQDKVIYEYSWYDNTYFDEIYHPRTAYEYTQNLHPYENTHPPFGKILISWGIMLFGMNPFGWRFFGTLCGVLMVPLAYMFGKKMFKKTSWASLVCVIFTFDFMHLSQTRLATIDSFTTFFVMGMYFFMYLYMKESFYNSKKSVLLLLMSGIFFGLGAATKWQGIYAGIGLAVLFFITYFKRWREYIEAKAKLKKGSKRAKVDSERLNFIVDNYKSYAIKTILYGVLFFVVIPAIIYFLSYIPTMNNEGQGIKYFFKNQETMFNYHSSIEGKHSYMSSWWSWLFDYKPLYAYSPNRMFVPEGTAQGISTFGNPLVWMLTIPAVLGVIYLLLRRKGNQELSTMLAGFFAMLLPWALISRSSFIYHFFPCVIFVVLMIVYLLKTWYELKPCTTRAVAVGTYASLVVVLFAAFYPVLTGMAIPETYAAALEWMPSWVLG